MTDLILRGGRPKGCPATGSAAMARAAVAPAATSKSHSSGLWAPTTTAASARADATASRPCAAPSGPRTETCVGTVTRVATGGVDVFDRHTKHTVRVRAGHSYLARDAR